MTPTLLDVTMITGLDIRSPDPAAHRMVEVPFKLSSKTDCTNWSTYMNQHMKTKGPVSKKEHTAFLNPWLEHFIFCGPSLAPTKNYLPLAYHMAHGNHTSLGKLFLGETYRCLHLMTTSLLLALLKYPFYPLFILDNGMNSISKSLIALTPA